MPPAPKALHHSPRVPIPTERNPTGRHSTTRTEVAVQESKESAARVKEMRRERQATKHTGSQDTDPVYH
jgi:sRNA-binding protein